MICFHLLDYYYTYLQYLTSQIFSLSLSNAIRDKNRHFIIFCAKCENSDLFPKKNYYEFIEPFSQFNKADFGEHI